MQPKCFRSHSQSNKARLALKIHQRIEENTFKNLCKTFQMQDKWPQHPQEFQEKKTSKTKQRTPSDKQEKHKNKES